MRYLLSFLAVVALTAGYQLPIQQSVEVDYERTWRPTRMSVTGPTVWGALVVETGAGGLTFRDDARLHDLVRGTRYRLLYERPLLGDDPARLGAIEAVATQLASN